METWLKLAYSPDRAVGALIQGLRDATNLSLSDLLKPPKWAKFDFKSQNRDNMEK